MLYDAAAGIYLTKTRAYNPKTGRFLQRDILDEDAKDGYKGFPFGKDAIGTNLYAWCGNDPINRVDPSGQTYYWVDQGSYCYEVSYCDWVDQGSYCDLDGNYYPVGYWNPVYYWEMVYVGYYAWVDDGVNGCYEAPATSPPPPPTLKPPSLTGPMAKANDPYGNIKMLPPNNEEYLANESACPRTGLDLIGLGSYAGGPVVGTMANRSALAVNMAFDGYFYGGKRRNGEGGGFDFWSSFAWNLVGVQSWIPGADVVPGIINTAGHSYGCLAN